VTRADLPSATQACQLAHVAVEFSIAHPELVREWHGLSNTLVLLSVPDELRLSRLHADALTAGRRVIAFHEPDLAGSMTAVALEPAARRLVARLRLALPPPPSTVDVHLGREPWGEVKP
jgi:peptidyl-tRNA hydrolase